MRKLGFSYVLALALVGLSAGCDDDDEDARMDAAAGPDGAVSDGAPKLDGAQGDRPDGAPTGDAPSGDSAVTDGSPGDGAATDSLGGPDVGVSDAPAGQTFVATLTGSQEVPPVTTTAMGTLTLVLNAARTEVMFTLQHTVANATAGHLHLAPAGVNGPVAIPFPSIGPAATGTLAITADQLKALEEGGVYANVHTMANPGGEIRGQVVMPGETLYTAVLTGAAEVPPVTTTATGGIGFMLDSSRTTLRYYGEVMGLNPTAAHIHAGAAGVSGPVVYPLDRRMGTTLVGSQAVTAADLTALDGGMWYANVHTGANPGGEIRGQITKP